MLAVIEEIRRGLHMLDHFFHRAFDMLEHRIDCAFSPANCLLNLFELFRGTINRRLGPSTFSCTRASTLPMLSVTATCCSSMLRWL